MSDLRDKTVLITGGTRGVGLKAAKQLLDSGCRVILNFAHDSSAARSSLNQLKMLSPEVELYRADVSDEEEVCAMFANLSESYSNVDAVIHCAGFGSMTLPDEVTEDEWMQRLFQVYICGAKLCARSFVKYFHSAEQGTFWVLHPRLPESCSESAAAALLAGKCAGELALICRELYKSYNIDFFSGSALCR